MCVCLEWKVRERKFGLELVVISSSGVELVANDDVIVQNIGGWVRLKVIITSPRMHVNMMHLVEKMGIHYSYDAIFSGPSRWYTLRRQALCK